ncbi:hypothetical protein ACWCQP_39620 [Streptomyces chartreusis]
MKRTTLGRPDASSPAIAAALAPTGHPHPLLAEQAREHPTTHTPAEAAAIAAQTVAASLAGLTTNPRNVAELLHVAIDDAQAEHLARPEVGGFPLDEARGYEAFSTAMEAMTRALALTADRRSTARALRNALAMAIDEAGA